MASPPPLRRAPTMLSHAIAFSLALPLRIVLTPARAVASTRPVRATPRAAAMPRGVKKENLPSKICVVCDRPFNWRKKWERCWDEVTTCSKSCNAQRRRGKRDAGEGEGRD